MPQPKHSLTPDEIAALGHLNNRPWPRHVCLAEAKDPTRVPDGKKGFSVLSGAPPENTDFTSWSNGARAVSRHKAEEWLALLRRTAPDVYARLRAVQSRATRELCDAAERWDTGEDSPPGTVHLALAA